VALNIATLTRLQTLPSIDLLILQRDRAVCVAIFAMALLITGACNTTSVTDRFDSFYYAVLALIAAVLAQFLLVALIPRDWFVISRRELGLGAIFTFIPLITWRTSTASLVTRFQSLRRAFYIFGDSPEAKRIASELGRSVDSVVEASCENAKAIRATRKKFKAGEVRDAVICLKGEDREQLLPILEFCETHCRRTFLFPSVNDTFLFQHGGLVAVAGVPLIEIANQIPNGFYARSKRSIDFSIALFASLLALPLGLTTAILVLFTSRGGAFYTQERMGKNGRIFKIYKFRTMIANAETKEGPVWAEKNDVRITPLGKFLRKHRIDEIPQLINVLKGDMSLVGPRPERPNFHEQFSRDLPLFNRRLIVRPGVTSLSHVLGSYSSDPADRLRYDLTYIGNLSLLNDLKILLSTIRIVLSAKGAQ
jgi:exopolysaccharide biosynthesis polyprenyl glycosylphosphotransferase